MVLTEGRGEWAGPGREPVSECAGHWQACGAMLQGLTRINSRVAGVTSGIMNGLDLAGPAQSWS
jgi:hypothetical protein